MAGLKDALGNIFGDWHLDGQKQCAGCGRQTLHDVRQVESRTHKGDAVLWREYRCRVDGAVQASSQTVVKTK